MREPLATWTRETNRGSPLEYEWSELAAGVDRHMANALATLDLDELARNRERSESLTPAVAIEALSAANVLGELPRSFDSLEETGTTWRIAPAQRKLVRRWLADIERAGGIRRNPDTSQMTCDREALERLALRTPGARPAFFDEMVVALVDVLTGRRHVLELSFAEARPAWVAQYVSGYLANGAPASCHGVVAQIVADLASKSPVGRPLRILEVGAGFGRLTQRVLAALEERAPGRPLHYAFTDVSAYFLRSAQERFRADGMIFDRFDIDRDPRALGMPSGAFDVILAFEVIHCARNIDRTLAHLHYLLQPGGGVLIAEELAGNSAGHLVFPGMMPGFMNFEDERLSHFGTLLEPEEWRDRLLKTGFRAVSMAPGDGAQAARLGEAVLVALA
jgi:microcystin synthetase protein McyD